MNDITLDTRYACTYFTFGTTIHHVYGIMDVDIEFQHVHVHATAGEPWRTCGCTQTHKLAETVSPPAEYLRPQRSIACYLRSSHRS